MRAAVLTGKLMAIAIGTLVSLTATSQEYSAGINTETPNPNAVLHLVSPNGDQGLLVPIVPNFSSFSLTSADNGLLVFNSTDQQFYFYSDPNWIPLRRVTTNDIVDGTIQDIDIQDVDWSKVSGLPVGFADNTDDVDDLDPDPANETISSAALAGSMLTITEAGIPYSVDLSSLTGSSQDLQFVANQLTLSGDPTPTAIDFSAWDTDASDDFDGLFTSLSAIPTDLADGDDGITAINRDITTLNGDGVLTPLGVNVGTGANQIVQLDGLGFLPAIDGSQLMNISAGTVNTDNATITGDGSAGTPLMVATVPVGQVSGLSTVAITGNFADLLTIPTGLSDGDDVGITAVTVDGSTITGDGNATQLAVGTVPAGQISGLSTVATTGNFADLLTIPTGLADGDDVGITAVTVDGTTITGDGNATQLAVGTVPAAQVSGLSTIATTGSFADLTTSIVINPTLAGTGIAGTPLGVNIGTGANQIVQLNGAGQLPIVDGSQLTNMADMFQSTYDPNAISGDAFDFGNHLTSTAPTSGEVLTFNGLIWDAAPINLTLPYSQSAISATDLFYLTNTGAGGAGFFEVINSGNGSNALTASTDGSGSAFRASQSGTGTAIDVSVSNASNFNAGIYISHSGVGAGIDIILGGSNPSPGINIFNQGSGAAISTNSTGTGPAGLFQINNGSSTSPAIQVVNTGVGADIQLPTGATAGYVLTANDVSGNASWQPGVGLSLPYTQTVLNSADLFTLTNTGTGGAGSFNINNGLNPANALNASTNGSGAAIRAVQSGIAGPGIDLSISGVANSSPGMLISHAGLGTGLDISLNLATNPGNGVTVNHAGLGSAGSFSAPNGLNTFPALNVSTVGTGPAIEARSTGTGPDLRLSGTIPIQITDSPGVGKVLTSDATGFGSWQTASGFTLPYSDVTGNLAAPLTLFEIGNTNSGSAATFRSTTNATALEIQGHITYLNGNGITRELGVQASVGGNGDPLSIYSGDAGGPGPNNGGSLILNGGQGAGTGGVGGPVLISGGDSPGGSGGNVQINGGNGTFNGGIFMNGVTRFGNPATGVLGGGTIELEDDGGANALIIRAHETSNAYDIIFPQTQGSGSLTNDGSGNLSWSTSGFLAPLFQDLNNVVFGSSTPSAIKLSPDFQLGTVAPTGQAILSAISHTQQSQVSLVRANGSEGSETPVGLGDVIGEIAFVGWNGSSYLRNAHIRGVATESWGAARGTAITFNSTPTGSGTDVEVMRIAENQVAINVNNPSNAALLLNNSSATGPDLQLSGNIPLYIPGGNAGEVLTSDISGFGTWQPAGGAFTLDGNNNLTANTAASPIGIDNFLAGQNAGLGLTTSGSGNIAIGVNAGRYLTGGQENVVLGTDAGGSTLLTGNGNVAIGQSATISENTSPHVVIGQGATVSGILAVAVGPLSNASGDRAMAYGDNASSQGNFSIAIGSGSVINPGANNSIAIGENTAVAGSNSIALGAGVSVSASNTAVIGNPSTPMNVGIATNTPVARLDVHKIAGETGDVLNLSHTGNSGRGIFVTNANGGGEAGRFEVTNAVNSADAMFVSTVATGNGIFVGHGGTNGNGVVIDLTNAGNTRAAIEIANAGAGRSAYFRTINTSNTMATIDAQHQGDGNVAFFNQTNALSGADAMFVQTLGGGSAASFQINNNLNPAPIISATTNGTGAGGQFVLNNTGSTSPALFASTTGLGNTVEIDHQGTAGLGLSINMNSLGAEGIKISNTNAGIMSIDVDASIQIGERFISTPAPAVFSTGGGVPLPNIHRVLRISGPGSFSSIDPGADGQEIIVVCASGAPQAQNSGNMHLDNNGNFTMAAGSTIHLMWIQSLNQWVEISRSL